MQEISKIKDTKEYRLSLALEPLHRNGLLILGLQRINILTKIEARAFQGVSILII